MNIRWLLLVAALPLALLTWGPAPTAHALSCVEPSVVLAEASQVYTGRVTDSRDGRIQVDVVEVWSGGPVAEQVWLDVELASWTGWAGPDGEIPDGLTTAEEWVFAPEVDGTVNPCVMWELRGGSEVLEHRPDQPTAPSAAVPEDDRSGPVSGNLSHDAVGQTVWWPWGTGAALLGLIAAVGIGRWVRRRVQVSR